MEEECSLPADHSPLTGCSADNTSIDSSDTLIEYYQPPRLGIIHLLGWITFAAVMMKFNLSIEVNGAGPLKLSELLILINKLIKAGSAIGSAAIVTGGIVFWMDRFRRKPGKLQPGHWIVAVYSLAIPVEMFFMYLISYMQAGSRQFSYQTFLVYFNLAWAIPISFALGWGILRLPGPRRWKWGMGLLSSQYLGIILFFIVFWLTGNSSSRGVNKSFDFVTLLKWLVPLMTYFVYAVAAFYLLLNIIDIVKGLRRDWLHWLGAVIPILSVMTTIVGKVVHALLYVPPKNLF